MEFDLGKKYCYYFNEICKTPHGSRNERPLSDRLVAFAQRRNLRYVQDEMWNVVIYKEASHGYEDHPAVLIQAHMDMVCERVPDSTHNFETEPLELYVEGDHLRAKGTTLGADDGMGCAYMLAILDDDTLQHPALECCFTTQEEVGLCGAQALKPDYFKARRMVNLDGAGEVKTYMSMAGGQQATVTAPAAMAPNTDKTYTLTVSGLLGGHSAAVADKEHANANKLLARVLQNMTVAGIDFALADVSGGTKHNVVADTAVATFASSADKQLLSDVTSACEQAVRDEYEFSDPDIHFALTDADTAQSAVPSDVSRQLVQLTYLLPNGLMARNMAVADNPPVTSCNLGTIRLEDGAYCCRLSIRSSLEAAITGLTDQIATIATLFGATMATDGYYPGWKYDSVSPLRETLKKVYFDIYQKELLCLIGHGGNECGVFKKMFPDMDVVTSGAIYGNIHTTDEFLDLASFDRAYKLLTTFLANL